MNENDIVTVTYWNGAGLTLALTNKPTRSRLCDHKDTREWHRITIQMTWHSQCYDTAVISVAIYAAKCNLKSTSKSSLWSQNTWRNLMIFAFF